MIEWCREHHIITRLIVLWALSLTTVVTLKVFFDPESIPAGTATAFGTFFALPGLAVGLWKWRYKHVRNSKEQE